MLTRRHIRIKTFLALYSYQFSKSSDVQKGEKELMFSLNKVFEMYCVYLSLFNEIKNFAEQKIEDAKGKNFPTEDELNPNLKFVNNRVFQLLNSNKSLNEEIKRKKIQWQGEAEFNVVKQIYLDLKNSDKYREYMNSGDDSLHEDKQYLIYIFKNHIITNELLHELLEDKSIFWNDDLDIVATGVTNTIDSFRNESNEHHQLIQLFKDEADEQFAKDLFKYTLLNSSETDDLISNQTQNWDMDRLAKSDLILMSMAITEALKFPSIPTKVSLNEYIEISKYYSTPKSKGFINGILDKIFNQLNKEGKINKMGRGLINKSISK